MLAVVDTTRCTSDQFVGTIKANVQLDSIVYTDGFSAYNKLSVNGFHHERIDHSKELVSGSATLTDTGYNNWGYDLYQCVITANNDHALTAGYYWMTIDPVGGFYRWLASSHDNTWGSQAYFSSNGGSSWSSSTSHWGSAYEGFWVIESSETSIEEATWGQMKALD